MPVSTTAVDPLMTNLLEASMAIQATTEALFRSAQMAEIASRLRAIAEQCGAALRGLEQVGCVPPGDAVCLAGTHPSALEASGSQSPLDLTAATAQATSITARVVPGQSKTERTVVLHFDTDAAVYAFLTAAGPVATKGRPTASNMEALDRAVAEFLGAPIR